MTKTENLKTASVLAFERKLDCSDGLFYTGAWNARAEHDWPALALREKAIRGTISNRLKADLIKDPAKLDAEIEKPNLQTVDVATLSEGADTLRVRFTLKVLFGVGKPSACNSADYQRKLIEKVLQYSDANGYFELARRYAANLANGRFLWRNRLGAEEIEIQVRQIERGAVKHVWTFKALDHDLKKFNSDEQIQELGQLIERGLLGKEYVLFEVIAHARMGNGQEVYPSQELVTDKGKGQKSKFLYSVGDVAAIHSQKIGNALRTIDDWYLVGDDETAIGPISVEPYGSVTNLGKAFRPPKEKHDFYTLLDRWVLRDEAPSLEDQHFVMATFIRGGVFGEKAE